jgi:hypothetical protein
MIKKAIISSRRLLAEKIRGRKMKSLKRIPVLEQIKLHPNVLAIYLFGSYAKSKANPISDIDIAVILDNPTKEIEADIGSLYSEKIDLVLFHRLPLYIRFEVFKYGQEIFNRDEKKLLEIKRKVLGEYLDTSWLYKNIVLKVLR